MTTALHLLRPWWLLALLPAAALAWRLGRGQDPARAWRGIVADHLLPALLVGQENRPRIRPVHLLSFTWALAAIALAGPAWRREPSPFADDSAPLAIVLKVTPSMRTRDLQPDRLARSTQKIRDLLRLRPGGRTALIAYGGSAHRVLPLTRDADLVATYAGELSPDVMPLADGDSCADALRLARVELARPGAPGGWILWICDAVAPDPAGPLRDSTAREPAPITILAASSDGPESDSIRAAAASLDAPLVRITPDDRDVRRLAENARFVAGAAPGEDVRWRDDGYWLVPPITLLGLLSFRRGWMIPSVARGRAR